MRVDGPQGRLWGSLKIGRLWGGRFATQREAMDDVIDWLTFYNHRRLHFTLGDISPIKFEEHWHAGRARKAASPIGYGRRLTGQGQTSSFVQTASLCRMSSIILKVCSNPVTLFLVLHPSGADLGSRAAERRAPQPRR